MDGEYRMNKLYRLFTAKNMLVPMKPWFSLALKTMKWSEEKLACESVRLFGLLFSFFAYETRGEKSRCPRTLKKTTSDWIEPRVYELWTIQPEVSSEVRTLQGRSFPDRWSRETKTLGTRLLAFQLKPPTSLSGRTISDVTGDFGLIWYSVRVYRPVRNFFAILTLRFDL